MSSIEGRFLQRYLPKKEHFSAKCIYDSLDGITTATGSPIGSPMAIILGTNFRLVRRVGASP